MTKYRVKEIRNYNGKYFILQKRFLFVLWRTLEAWDEFEFPIPYGCPRKFDSKENAIKYVEVLKQIKEIEKKRDNALGSTIVAKLNKYGEEIVSK